MNRSLPSGFQSIGKLVFGRVRELIWPLGISCAGEAVARGLWPEPLAGGRLRPWLAILCALTGIWGGLLPFVLLTGKEHRIVESVLPLTSLHRDGQAYFAYAREARVRQVIGELGGDWVLGPFDSNEQPQAARHRLRVNEALLTSPHAPHGAIVREGGGRYSFWRGATAEESGIYFSLPPETDATEALESVIVEWHVERMSKGLQASLSTVSVVMILLVALFSWWAYGSLPAVSSWMILGAPWGAVVGVFFPEISGANADEIQRVAVEWLSFAFVAALVLAVVSWLGSILFRISGISKRDTVDVIVGQAALGATVPALLLLWLGATWVGPAPVKDWTADGPSSAVLGGRLPFSDAAAWYVGSGAVGEGVKVEWVARRPMHALLRSGELTVAGDVYQYSLVLQALLVGSSIGGLLIVIARIASGAAALVALVGLVKYGGGFIGSYLSEASGLAAGSIGLGLSLLGWKEGRLGFRLWGYCLIALAAAIRPGPMFILLALPVSELLLCPGRRLIRATIAALLIGVVLVISSLAFRLISTADAAANANSANTVLGLSMGTHWGEATSRFFAEDPERRQLSTKEMTREMYKMAWRQFSEDPRPSVRLLLSNLSNGLNALTLDLALRVTGFAKVGWYIWAFACMVLIWITLKGEKWPVYLVLLAIGLVSSLPLIWSDGGWRGTTFGLPIFFTILSLVLSIQPRQSPSGIGWVSLYLKTIGAIIFSLIVIAVVRHSASKPPPVDAPIVVDGGSDAVVNILDSVVRPKSIGPLATRPIDLSLALHRTGLSIYKLDETLKDFPPPFAIFVVAPNRAKPERSLWLVFPGLVVSSDTRVRIDRYTELPDGYTARVDEWTLLQ